MKKITFIIIASLLLVFINSCSSEVTINSKEDADKINDARRALVEQNIADPDKKEKILKYLNEVETMIGNFVEDFYNERKAFTELNKDYNLSEERLREISDNHEQKYREYLISMVEMRSKIKSLCSDEEWEKINIWDGSYIVK